MSQLILHHYPMSPFSQKIRSMLGYAQLPWQSVITREMPPRPMVAQLAGGYRKIPVAQTGADVFCDSKVIAAEIAALSGKPALALENCSAEIQAYVAEVDLEIFLACVMGGGTRTLNRKVRESMSWLDLSRFIWDRVNLGRKANVKAAGFRQARPRVLKHLADVENRLQQDFLFGMQPDHADFSTYHSLWFIRELAESSMVNAFPKTMRWMDRMKAFGEGMRSDISGETALTIAAAATPRPVPAPMLADPLVGTRVRIAPSDYAQSPTTGVLAGADASRWILAREEPALGTLHVHFPRQGFVLTPAG
jgi:glutathione S-transferase